jgi:ribosome-binding protein aMBF1 (putative translation factor)
MIRNEKEYREAAAQLAEEKARIEAQQIELQKLGLNPEEIKRAIDPILSFHLQLAEEVESYERLKRGEFEDLNNFHGLGQLLTSLRIARGMSQRQLAERLGVHESMVSRDERNEYHGIALERAAKILDALGVELHSTVVIRPNNSSLTPAEYPLS